MYERNVFKIHFDEDLYCYILGLVGFVLFVFTTIKSLYDLIFDEIIHRDVPLCKWTWKKVFHYILPCIQITQCVNISFFNADCVPMDIQELPHYVLTALSNYLIMFCCLLNGVQWAFLADNEIKKKSKRIYMLAVIFFILIPIGLVIPEFITTISKNIKIYIHMGEAIYSSLVTLCIIPILIYSWWLLRSCMRKFLNLSTSKQVEDKLLLQMLLYIIFLSLHSTFLITVSVLLMKRPRISNLLLPRLFFFLYTGCGDLPLTFVMLYFLRYRGRPYKKKIKESEEEGGVNNKNKKVINPSPSPNSPSYQHSHVPVLTGLRINADSPRTTFTLSMLSSNLSFQEDGFSSPSPSTYRLFNENKNDKNIYNSFYDKK